MTKQPKQPKQRAQKRVQNTTKVLGAYPLFPDLAVPQVRALRVSEFVGDNQVESFKEFAEPTADASGLFNVFARPEQRDIHFLVEALDADGTEIARVEVRHHSDAPPTGEGPAHIRDDGSLVPSHGQAPIVVERDQMAVPSSASVSDVRTLAREASMLGHLDATGRALTRAIEFANTELTRSFVGMLRDVMGEETPRVRELLKLVTDLRKALDDVTFRARSAEAQYQQSVLTMERQALDSTRASLAEIVSLQKRISALEVDLLKAQGDLERQKEETRQREGIFKSMLIEGAVNAAPELLQRAAAALGLKLPAPGGGS